MLRAAMAVLATLTVATACGQPTEVAVSAGKVATPDPEGPAEPCSYAAVDFTHTFRTITELVRGSDEVLLGVVTGADLGPIQGPADAKSQRRTLTVAIEETFKDDLPRSIKVLTIGYDYDGETQGTGPDCPWLSVGDRRPGHAG